MWRSAVTHKLSGKASFAFTTGYALENFVGKDTIPKLFPTQPISASFTTPATYSMGVSNSSLLKGLLALQLDIQDYKRFKDVPLNFTQTVDTATPAELRLTFAMRTSYILRGGYERYIGDKNTLRVGYVLDRSPVTDKSVGPLFPDSTRDSVTFGVSRRMNNREFSFFYQAMWFRDRLTNVAENQKVFTNGDYNNFVHLFGFGMRMRLGASTNPFDR
jgi:long-subunit fatty acid transport protein